MGVAVSRLLLCSFFTSISYGLWAAPQLRLSTATVGPVSVAEKASGPAQLIEAYNIGDGSLSLKVTASADWLIPATGALRPCQSRAGACIPIEMQLRTSSLAKGIYTGLVTIEDPNAVDAPQTVTVTVQIGGGIPDQIEFLAPPGGAGSVVVTTNSEIRGQSDQPWLSLALDASGSFRFTYPYRIRASAAGMGEGSYHGALTISGSSFAPDNKTVNVTLRVTSQPIGRVTPARLSVRLAQGAPRQTRWLSLENSGLGSLTLTGVKSSMASGENWLSTGTPVGFLVPVVLDVGQLAPKTYQGTVELATNAANGTLAVPVDLEVVPKSQPLTFFGGVVNNVNFLPGPIAQGDLAALFGDQLLFKDPAQAGSLPLENNMGGVRVLVNGQPAPIYYASYGQINFQIPYGTPAGSAVVQVERDGERGNTISAEVAERAPRLMRLGIGDYGLIVNQDYTFPIPETAGLASHPAHPGDALTLYALGLGLTDPPVGDGAGAPAAEPLARIPGPVKVHFNGGFQGYSSSADPFFTGLTPNFVGLFQINVIIPEDVTRGREVPVYLDLGGIFSNRVNIAIE
jgi:uncharacterized protein (TIGR03437 family)